MNWAKLSHVYLPSQDACSAKTGSRSPGIWLKYNTLIPDPARQVFPIQILEQGDRVFPRNACNFLKCRNRKPRAALLPELRECLAQLGDYHLVED